MVCSQLDYTEAEAASPFIYHFYLPLDMCGSHNTHTGHNNLSNYGHLGQDTRRIRYHAFHPCVVATGIWKQDQGFALDMKMSTMASCGQLHGRNVCKNIQILLKCKIATVDYNF